MNEKKARKILNKILKKKSKAAEQKSWAMYEVAGCEKCNRGQLYSGGESALSITYYSRCECSKVKTKKYKKFLKNRKNMKVSDAEAIENKFYDNNDNITVGNNAEDRSW